MSDHNHQDTPGSSSVIFNTKWGIASVIVVAVVLGSASTVLASTWFRHHNNTAASASTSASHGSAAHGKAKPALGDPGSVCGLTGYETDMDEPYVIPTTTWAGSGPAKTVDGDPIRGMEEMQLPSIDQQGPGTLSPDGVRTCFARTQAGAVLAAANMVSVQANPSIGAAVVAATTADGPGEDAAIAAAKQRSYQPFTQTFQIVGYRLDSFDGNTTVVTVALSNGRAQLLGAPVSMVWQAGDWKTTLTADGQQPRQPSALSSLGGFTPWSAS